MDVHIPQLALERSDLGGGQSGDRPGERPGRRTRNTAAQREKDAGRRCRVGVSMNVLTGQPVRGQARVADVVGQIRSGERQRAASGRGGSVAGGPFVRTGQRDCERRLGLRGDGRDDCQEAGQECFHGVGLGQELVGQLTPEVTGAATRSTNIPPIRSAMCVLAHMDLVSAGVPGSKEPCPTGWPPFFSESSKG